MTNEETIKGLQTYDMSKVEQAMFKLKNCGIEPIYLYCNSKENITKADIPPNIILVKSPLVELGKIYITSEKYI